jgi:hypothetical protein
LKGKKSGDPPCELRKFLVVMMLCVTTGVLFAQEAAVQPVRSWYVSAQGKDDNNGRRPDTAFATFGKAFSSAAAGNVKTITVVGAIQGYGRNFSGDFPYEGSGAAEILVTGMDENAVVNSNIRLGHPNMAGSNPSKIRIEKLRFGYADYKAGGIEVHGNITLTIGKDAVFDLIGDYFSDPALEFNGDATLIMEANAAIRAGKGGVAAKGDAAVALRDSAFIMKDDTRISGFGFGILASGSCNITLQDNAKITGCDGRGVTLSAGDNYTLSFTMKDNTSISGNGSGAGGGGLKVDAARGAVVIQDNASITDNTAKDSYGALGMGGGIFVERGEALIKGNAVISGNKAKQGGGIYFRGGDNNGYSATIGGTAKQPLVQVSKDPNLTIQDKVQITGNEAQEGGGIYAIEGGSFYTLSFTSANDHYDGNNSFYNQITTASVQPLTQAFTGITMKGGTISGNKADYGAGVYAVQALQVDLLKVDTSELLRDPFLRQKFSGYTTVIKPTGQKVIVPAFTLAEGSITGNEAQFVGGGVYAKAAAAFNKGAGTLSGNTAGDGEGEDLYTP